MVAMTMDHPAKDEKDWNALQSNQAITAIVEVRGTEYAIYDVKPEQVTGQRR